MSSCTGTIPRPLLLSGTPVGMPAASISAEIPAGNFGLLLRIAIRTGTGTASGASAGAGSPVALMTPFIFIIVLPVISIGEVRNYPVHFFIGVNEHADAPHVHNRPSEHFELFNVKTVPYPRGCGIHKPRIIRAYSKRIRLVRQTDNKRYAIPAVIPVIHADVQAALRDHTEALQNHRYVRMVKHNQQYPPRSRTAPVPRQGAA